MAIFQQGLFQIDAKDTPQSIARKRAIVAQIMGSNSAPKTIGEGLNALGDGIVANVLNRRADAAEQTGLAGANDLQTKFANWISGRNTFPDAPSSGSVDATGDVASSRVAQAFGDSALPQSFLSAVDSAEGGGDYDTLYGFAQRDGKPFAGTRVSNMSVKDAIAFADPSGPYAQSVKGQIGRVATPMGRHQIVGTTLRNAVGEMGIDPSTPFNRQTQDSIAAHLARRRLASETTMDGKVAALRSEWHGFNNVPTAQMRQIVTDLEAGGSPSAAPVQVASLDPSAGMPSAIPPVPEEYARTGLSQAAWERMNAPNGAVPPVQPAPTPGPANVPVASGKGDRVSMAQTAAVPMQPGPIPNANPVQAAFIDRMTNPQSMTGGSPMPLQGMPQPAPKQVAQAEPDLSRVPVMAGGTAGARQAGDAPPVDMGLLMQVMSNPFVDENTKAFAANMIEQQMKSQDPSNQLDMDYRRAQIAKMQREAAGLGKDATVQSSVVLDDGTSVLVMNDGKRRVLGPTGEELSGQSAADAIRAARQYGVDNQKDIYSGRRAGTLGADIELGADAEAQKASGRASGKGEGEAQVAYKSMLSKMPGLEKVVGELSGLADEATYTTTGQWVDWGRKELGMEPRDAAVARTKYTSMVDNQILPLLRDTFGAQFTVQEGESLRATLGDPDKTPTEKKQVLEAFIEQKRRDVEALAVQAGGSPAAPSGDNWQDVGGVKIRRKQ